MSARCSGLLSVFKMTPRMLCPWSGGGKVGFQWKMTKAKGDIPFISSFRRPSNAIHTGAPLRIYRLLKAPPSRAPPPRAPPLQTKVILLLILDFRKVHVQTVVLPTQVFLEFSSRHLPGSMKPRVSRCPSVAFLTS